WECSEVWSRAPWWPRSSRWRSASCPSRRTSARSRKGWASCPSPAARST
ncbi:MAG: hypothetical protein AVDCRST_MAG48-2478, partial [uncultured Friedmanniella sp.]